jgi:esterase/lipase superfamily enzyme
MHVEERLWFSPALGHDMALKVYGHDGRPVIAFPSQDGRYWDFESWGMVDACTGFIHRPIAAGATTPTTATSPRRSRRSSVT